MHRVYVLCVHHCQYDYEYVMRMVRKAKLQKLLNVKVLAKAQDK